jgi:hypothetical protein
MVSIVSEEWIVGVYTPTVCWFTFSALSERLDVLALFKAKNEG